MASLFSVSLTLCNRSVPASFPTSEQEAESRLVVKRWQMRDNLLTRGYSTPVRYEFRYAKQDVSGRHLLLALRLGQKGIRLENVTHHECGS